MYLLISNLKQVNAIFLEYFQKNVNMLLIKKKMPKCITDEVVILMKNNSDKNKRK